MNTITFDTHKFVRKLESAGFPQQQAEAVADAFREASGEAELPNKRDLELVRQDIRELELRIYARFAALDGDLKLNRWMLGAIVVAEVVPLLAKRFQ
jgi:hypothetical protein